MALTYPPLAATINTFIGDRLTTAQKLAMLNDFNEDMGYLEEVAGGSTETPTQFFNRRVSQFIMARIHRIRQRRAHEAAAWELLEIGNEE